MRRVWHGKTSAGREAGAAQGDLRPEAALRCFDHALSIDPYFEAATEGRPAFYYVRSDEYYSPVGRELHFRLLWLYAPLNWIDTTFFGGMPAARGGIHRLG